MSVTSAAPRLTIVTEVSSAKLWRKRGLSLFAHALLIGASILMLYPLLWMLSASFRPENEIFNATTLWPSEWSLDSYFRGWHGLRVSFGTFFANSLVIAILCVCGNLIACSMVAFAFARLQFKGRTFWFAMMLMTLMLPSQVTLIPQYVLFRSIGWVDTVLPLVAPKFLAVDGFFLEFDDERSGGFAPLRFVPPGKTVVLGLVTTKRGALESKEALKRRIDEASRYVPLEQLCLSPQCGFSSTVEGNVLSYDEEVAKLRLIVETAEEVWG